MTDKTASYQRWIDAGTSLAAMSEKQLGEVPPDRIPVVHASIGSVGLMAAIGYLMQGNVTEARSWFRKTAENNLKSASYQSDTVMPEMECLEAATLCGDRDSRVEMAQGIPVRPPRERPHEYPYEMFLKYTILGQQDEAICFADEAAAKNPSLMKKRGGYGALGAICKALDDRNPVAFQVTMEELLTEHKLKAARGFRNLHRGAICLPGATLLMLARDLGLQVCVQSPYIPTVLLD